MMCLVRGAKNDMIALVRESTNNVLFCFVRETNKNSICWCVMQKHVVFVREAKQS